MTIHHRPTDRREEAIIEFNRQRERTPAQVVNEFEEVLAIERERAKKRLRAEGNQFEGQEKFPETQKGQTRDKAAETVAADVSGRTLENGKRVKDLATGASARVETEAPPPFHLERSTRGVFPDRSNRRA